MRLHMDYSPRSSSTTPLLPSLLTFSVFNFKRLSPISIISPVTRPKPRSGLARVASPAPRIFSSSSRLPQQTKPSPARDRVVSYTELLRKADPPRGWPPTLKDTQLKDLVKEKECWSPEKLSLREFPACARDGGGDLSSIPHYEYLLTICS